MNLTVNEAYLKLKKSKAGRWQLIGIVMLAVSLIMSLAPTYEPSAYWLIFLAYPLLIVGFPLWQSGRGRSYYWKTATKLTSTVAEEIQPGPKSRLFAYLPVGATVVDYLLVAPEGLYVIAFKGITEDEKGRSTITCRQKNSKDQWSQQLGLIEKLVRLGELPLGNPTQELDERIAALKAWMQEQGLPEAPIWGVVVFRQGATPLNIEESTYEVMHLNELRAFLNYGQYFDQDMLPALHGEARGRIISALGGLIGAEAVAPQPAKVAAVPARKLSAAAVAERERVREIRSARAAGTGTVATRKPGPAREGRVPTAPAARPPAKNGTGGTRKG